MSLPLCAKCDGPTQPASSSSFAGWCGRCRISTSAEFRRRPTHWLSYGGGVNSTALAVLLCEGKLPQYEPFRMIWSDTQDEKPETYAYIRDVFEPYLARFGRTLQKVVPVYGVLERWQKYSMVGSRVIRSCTDYGKIKPLEAFLRENSATGDLSIIGIDAGEPHRARQHPKDFLPKIFPLIDLGLDRDGCLEVIQSAGLPPPRQIWLLALPLYASAGVEGLV